MIAGVNHMSFTVSDLDASVKFYRDVLGLKVLDVSARDSKFSQKVTGIEKAKLRIAYLSGNNCSLELVQYLSPKGKKLDTATCNVGSAHICFNVKNFRKFIGKLKKIKSGLQMSRRWCLQDLTGESSSSTPKTPIQTIWNLYPQNIDRIGILGGIEKFSLRSGCHQLALS